MRRLLFSRLSLLPRCSARALSTSESTATPVVVETIPMIYKPPFDEEGRLRGVGRRKTSSAVVTIKEGSGNFIVNDKPLFEYFLSVQRAECMLPFIATNTAGMFDVWCSAKGGGPTGKAGAIRLGLSRALKKFDPELRLSLKKEGLLTRDSRRVERKKPGRKKARKQYQWVKR